MAGARTASSCHSAAAVALTENTSSGWRSVQPASLKVRSMRQSSGRRAERQWVQLELKRCSSAVEARCATAMSTAVRARHARRKRSASAMQ
eukprot:9946155-Lingulodinium_polyedra.AAC.1